MKQQHILWGFDVPDEVSVKLKEKLNARQRPLFSVVRKRLKTKGC